MYKKLILLDIHTQRDFFAPGGTLYRRSSSEVVQNIYRLVDWARSSHIPVLSTVLQRRWGDMGPLGQKPYCVEGSGGEDKLTRSLLPNRINLGLAHTADLPRDLLDHYDQIIFETRDEDIFHHQKFERLVSELDSDYTFILCGATVSYGVKQAVLGLRKRNYQVVLASNAVLDLGEPLAEMAWLQILAKSAVSIPTAQVLREYVPSRQRSRLPA